MYTMLVDISSIVLTNSSRRTAAQERKQRKLSCSGTAYADRLSNQHRLGLTATPTTTGRSSWEQPRSRSGGISREARLHDEEERGCPEDIDRHQCPGQWPQKKAPKTRYSNKIMRRRGILLRNKDREQMLLLLCDDEAMVTGTRRRVLEPDV